MTSTAAGLRSAAISTGRSASAIRCTRGHSGPFSRLSHFCFSLRDDECRCCFRFPSGHG